MFVCAAVGVSVGGIGVFVGVAVGVSVRGTGVFVGGTVVLVADGSGASVGGADVSVGSMCVSIGGPVVLVCRARAASVSAVVITADGEDGTVGVEGVPEGSSTLFGVSEFSVVGVSGAAAGDGLKITLFSGSKNTIPKTNKIITEVIYIISRTRRSEEGGG